MLAAAPFRKCRRVTRLRSLVVGPPDGPAEVYLGAISIDFDQPCPLESFTSTLRIPGPVGVK